LISDDIEFAVPKIYRIIIVIIHAGGITPSTLIATCESAVYLFGAVPKSTKAIESLCFLEQPDCFIIAVRMQYIRITLPFGMFKVVYLPVR